MKLYYIPGACSLASHIILHETGATVDIEKVDGATHKTETGADFYQVHRKGYVPALQLDDGEVLTEGAAILQYLADTSTRTELSPAQGSIERARLQSQLNFVSAELHKAFGPLFKKDSTEGEKTAARKKVALRLDDVEAVLSDGRAYFLGKDFSIADAYLFTVTNWTNPTGLGLGERQNLAAYMGRMAERPSVQAAMQAEGLIGKAA
ncbi:glutathione transferase GstA [Nisaea sp.]|uniref:glutathione transferase GstA n=1 Tax=Nisaea sp. TaxID=2024842 RepID=UPI002B266F98|nr:glutathione transferase GstA [Nisaea sp.]